MAKLLEQDTDLQSLDSFPSLKVITKNSSISSLDSDEIEEELHYTSLKDLLLSSSSSSYFRSINHQDQAGINPELFDSSKILIRNRLVKSAASAYLQSALIIANKNENCLWNLLGKLKNNVEASFSCWDVYFRGPMEACFGAIYRFLACTFGDAWGRIFGYQEETLLNERRLLDEGCTVCW